MWVCLMAHFSTHHTEHFLHQVLMFHFKTNFTKMVVGRRKTFVGFPKNCVTKMLLLWSNHLLLPIDRFLLILCINPNLFFIRNPWSIYI